MSSSTRALTLFALLACAACGSSEPAGSGPDASAGSADASDEVPTLGGCNPLDVCSDASTATRVSMLFASPTGCQGLSGEQSCHSQGQAQLHLRLGDGGDVIDVPSTERPSMVRVKPFDPDNSYLYLKVVGDGGIEGGRMPLDVTTFDPRYPALIGEWIEAGAPSP